MKPFPSYHCSLLTTHRTLIDLFHNLPLINQKSISNKSNNGMLQEVKKRVMKYCLFSFTWESNNKRLVLLLPFCNSVLHGKGIFLFLFCIIHDILTDLERKPHCYIIYVPQFLRSWYLWVCFVTYFWKQHHEVGTRDWVALAMKELSMDT